MLYELANLKARIEKSASLASGSIDGEKPIVLYGAGNFGRGVLTTLRARNIPVQAFIDGVRREPGMCEGLPVYPLDHPQTTEYVRNGSVVLLAIFNHLTNWSEIIEVLRRRGFSQIVTPMEIFDRLPEMPAIRYWVAPPSYYLENWDSFLKGANLWEDESSREIYRRLLWFRAGRDLAAHPHPQLDCQYAPHDLPRWQEPIYLLDGGACVGEALQTFLKEGYRVAQLYAWEPDLANLEKLGSYLQKECPGLPTTLFPCGLGSKTDSVYFASGLGAASAIAEKGDYRTVILSADHAMGNQPVTLIKLDIEGAETDALLGMRLLIERTRPGLAICVYHRPDDLFQIPALIESWNLSYRLHLRVHCWNTFDAVLYAFPD
jgi:FkbM family methyltransferase